MLVKRIDKNSIPVGLYDAGEDLVKGRAVVVKNGKVMYPTTAEEAGAPLGFATLRIDTDGGGDIADHDIVPKGKKVVVYTLQKNNMWGTTEFDGELEVGDGLVVSYASDGTAGKLVKATEGITPLFEVYELTRAGSYPMIDVIVK